MRKSILCVCLLVLSTSSVQAADYHSLHEVLRHFQVAFVDRANPTSLYAGALWGLKNAAPRAHISLGANGTVFVKAGKKQVELSAKAMFDFEELEKALTQAADTLLAGGAAKKALWLERNMIRSMVAHCGDPWSIFLPAELYVRLLDDGSREMGSAGLLFEAGPWGLRILDVIEGLPAAKAGLRHGQGIEAVAGRPAANLNELEALALVRGAVGEKIKLRVEGKDFTLKLVPEPKRNISVDLLAGGLARIRLYNFRDGTGRRLASVMQKLGIKVPGGLKGLILDLRGNPGGLLTEATEVVGLFCPAGLVVQVISKKHMQSELEKSAHAGPYQKVPMVILADHRSASVSEIVIMALRDKERAKLVGTKTLGKGTVQVVMELMDGSAIKLSTGRYYSPRGTPLFTGIEPDVRIPWDGQGKDLQLERAVEILSR